VMTSARWGRMKTGRCLEVHPNLLATHGKDPLFLGCSENVLSIMDRKCSGRASCDVRIPDPVLDEIKPCYRDQTRYLEASYVCVKGLYEYLVIAVSTVRSLFMKEMKPLGLISSELVFIIFRHVSLLFSIIIQMLITIHKINKKLYKYINSVGIFTARRVCIVRTMPWQDVCLSVTRQ